MFARLSWLSLCLSLYSHHAFANVEPWQIPRVTERVVVDGELNEALWQQAKVVKLAYDTWPAENTPAPVATQAMLAEDGEYFYIAFKAQDPDPKAIRAFYRDRDKLWNDDHVGIKIDTYNDAKLAYQLFINPYGVQADAIENEITKMESMAWDGIWQSAGKITADGYQVEVAIPLRMLNFNDRLALQQWKIELVRFYPRDVKHRLSSNKIERNDPCWICQMHPAQGFAGVQQGNHLTLVPALVAGRSEQRRLAPAGHSAWRSEQDVEPSLDVKWGITPDINLNATLNPDFSQVEADEAQLSLNDTFTLFVEEKRTFFLDNADYFSSPLDLVYTRNVASPDAGVRLTGRHDASSFAFFAANDSQTTLIVPGNVSSDVAQWDSDSQNAVLRYRHDTTEQLSLGWISTLRQGDDYHNYVHGADVKYQWTPQDKLVAQALYSDSAYPVALAAQLAPEAALRVGAEDFSDQAQLLMYQHENRNWSSFSRIQRYDQGFRADMGYMPQTDMQKLTQGGTYQWFAEEQWWNRLQLWGDVDISHNDAGELVEKEAEFEIQLWGPAQSYGFIGGIKRDRVGSRFDGNSLRIDANSQLFAERLFTAGLESFPRSGLMLGMELEGGKTLDFRNNRLGDGVEIAPELKWNIDAHALLQLRHIYRSLSADSAKVFTANLSDIRLSYQFSVQSFLRLALIYSNVEQNLANNPQVPVGALGARSKGLGSQLLYSYKLNPQTLFFAGYSDNAYADDELTHLTRDKRSVFFKVSYAWML